MYELVEFLITLSGEAPIPGVPVLLLRFRGCNLHCRYCDTEYKDELACTFSQEELIQRIGDNGRDYPGIKVLLTGGEPLLPQRQPYLTELMTSLPEFDFYIETNGCQKINRTNPANSHFVMDWKTPSSGEEGSFCLENLTRLNPERDCLKFVAAGSDLDYIYEKVTYIQKVNNRLPVYISPQFQSVTLRELAAFILEHKLAANLSVQLHKLIWENESRGI